MRASRSRHRARCGCVLVAGQVSQSLATEVLLDQMRSHFVLPGGAGPVHSAAKDVGGGWLGVRLAASRRWLCIAAGSEDVFLEPRKQSPVRTEESAGQIQPRPRFPSSRIVLLDHGDTLLAGRTLHVFREGRFVSRSDPNDLIVHGPMIHSSIHEDGEQPFGMYRERLEPSFILFGDWNARRKTSLIPDHADNALVRAAIPRLFVLNRRSTGPPPA